MLRRKFIKDSLIGLPLVSLTPAILASCGKEKSITNTPNGKTVIIIGAGISGLAAAKKLKDQGFTVMVLEAQEKIGGRIRTNRSLEIAFDEGASWIHGPTGNPITPLAEQAGATTFLTDDDNEEIFDNNGSRYADTVIDSYYTQYQNALQAVIKEGSGDQSFQTVFNSIFPSKINDRLWKFMLSSDLEFDTGADISDLSSKYFDDDSLFSGKDVIVTNGYDKVTNLLGQTLDIRLNTRVTEINYASSKTIIKANGTNFEADYVIVSVPLGVLKNNVIAFTPALPTDKQNAINHLKMSSVNKFLLTWNAPFWDTSVQYIGYTPETKGKFNYFMNMNKFTTANALMTFTYGNYGAISETMTDEQVISEVIAHLKSIYGSNIPNPSKMLRTKWGQNVNSFGSYSYIANGTTSADFDTLANEVDQKLFFAGEHNRKRLQRNSTRGIFKWPKRSTKNY